jgi:catechol 2,3-dioxygenase-like lactoylglutathione lyase family enzyme
MAITSLHHFNLRIPEVELERAERFYTEVLGLHIGPRPLFGSKGVWLYAGDEPLLHLTQMNTGETVAPGAPTALPAVRERISALDHIALACENPGTARRRVRAGL